MIIDGNTLIKIDHEDVIDGVFTSPDDVFYIGDDLHCDGVVKMYLPNVIDIGEGFLYSNKTLNYLHIPKVERIGSDFLLANILLTSIYMPNIKEIGKYFLYWNEIFKYNRSIINAIDGHNIWVGGTTYNKKDYIRKLNLKKILC